MDTKSSYTEKLEVAVAKKKEELTAYEPYKPDEMFRFKGENIFSVEDFWQYAYSQLDGMAETIAEFLVAKAFGIKKAENVNYWTAYDMAYRNKRIEVKATSYVHPWNKTSVYKGYKQDKIEMRGDRAEMSDFPLYLNTVAGGLDRRDQTIGGFSFVVKIYAVPVVEIIG